MDGPPLRLQLGLVSSGNLGRYVLSGQDRHVYLIVPEFLRYPPTPQVLLDRELLAFPPWQAQRIVLAHGGRSVSLWRLKGRPGSATEWGSSADAARGRPDYQAFVAQLMSLTVQGYQSADVTPPPAQALRPERALLEVELYRAAPEPAAGAAPLPGHTPGPVQAWLRVYPDSGGKTWAVSSRTEQPVWVPGPPARQLLGTGQALLRSAGAAAPTHAARGQR